jgi:hypothetical protein
VLEFQKQHCFIIEFGRILGMKPMSCV